MLSLSVWELVADAVGGGASEGLAEFFGVGVRAAAVCELEFGVLTPGVVVVAVEVKNIKDLVHVFEAGFLVSHEAEETVESGVSSSTGFGEVALEFLTCSCQVKELVCEPKRANTNGSEDEHADGRGHHVQGNVFLGCSTRSSRLRWVLLLRSFVIDIVLVLGDPGNSLICNITKGETGDHSHGANEEKQGGGLDGKVP